MGKLETVIKQHYKDLGSYKVEVPEWGDENGPLEIYFAPVTLKERNELVPLMAKNDLKWAAKLIRMKACDASGEKLFDLKDEVAMANFGDFSVIDRVAAAILDPDKQAIERLGES